MIPKVTRPALFPPVFALALIVATLSGYIYAQNNSPATPFPSAVVLVANGIQTPLVPVLTTMSGQPGLFGDYTKFFTAHVPGAHATLRITDNKPQLLITLTYSPENICYLVQLSQDRHMFMKKNSRALELAAGHNIISHGSAASTQPIATSIISTTVAHNSDGTWTLTPVSPLPPGEYALYVVAANLNPGTAFDFGIDPPK